MKNTWNEEVFKNIKNDVDARVYSSRLLGKDKSLVLHGGGNTSVKAIEKNLFGEDEEILYVKGSGWDLETIEVEGYAPVKLEHLKRLVELPSLPDPEMVNELVTHMKRASAPTPSVEAILHAIIPYKYVDHTHADAVVTITNTPNGEEKIHQLYGEQVIVVPYVMPGFDLARVCAEQLRDNLTENTTGMVLLNHGIFSFGNSAKQSYDRMIELVQKAEDYLQQQSAWELEVKSVPVSNNLGMEIAGLRKQLSEIAGHPMVVSRFADSETMSFVSRADLGVIANQGPATPDHVIRTKRLPMVGRDLDSYVSEYQNYFTENEPLAKERKTILDSAPRVILDPELGMCTAGRSIKDANIVADIYKHTIRTIQRAELLGGYRALPAKDIFDVEYWDLEQAKLSKAGSSPIFSGEVALVTGAASGIGKACVDSLLARGAAVVGLDINPEIETIYKRADYLGVVCDVTSEDGLRDALEQTANTFGGLDMLVLNAGMFPGGCNVADLKMDDWRKVMTVNLDASFALMSIAHPYLCLAPNGGRVVVIGSKNVPAPGPGAAAYSASKAALNQLARVAALEWGEDNIRINSVHPNAVFDTGIWTEEVLASRAKHYGLTVDEYKTNNILKIEVTSHDVAELVSEMCGPLFAKTTASQVPVDGGNDRVI
ncbi:MAG: bifunctional aldolase/short-chain dehydrogenase [Gammaproteobacteria bacterium]|nr:bifunctional aldolase/short-chain dehydrogenase [Gammaproteobacteria bacterium]MCW8988891.1 bifunctional aldolase/short-chain dehydrogenase [Gammaproteobacteria bacterium]